MKKYFYATFFALTFLPLFVSAQENPAPVINSNLSGRVIEAKSLQPIEGAVIRIKGTTHEVISDKDGKYEFRTGQKLPYTLVVTHVGFQTLELIAHTNFTKIALTEQSVKLDE